MCVLNSMCVLTMAPVAKSRPGTDTRSPACAEIFGVGITTENRAGRSGEVPHEARCEATPPADKRSDAVGACTHSVGTNSGHSEAKNSPPAQHALVVDDVVDDTGRDAIGLMAGVDLVPQEPVPGGDGKIRCALIWCPEVPGGTRFALIRKNESGETEKLEGGVLMEQAPSLNLARIRQRGAQLGANEVVLILPQACASFD